MTEKNNNKKNLNKTDTNNISEQINILRNQVQNAKAIWQDRTHSAIENAKTNFLDITNKINNVAEIICIIQSIVSMISP